MKRSSFAGIQSKVHEAADKASFDFNEKQIDSESNRSFVMTLLKSFDELSTSEFDGTGEWAWLQKNKQNKFVNAVLRKDTGLISAFLTNMFRNEATYGYLSPSFTDALCSPEKVKSDILCNIDTCLEFTDLTHLGSLSTEHGNPFGLNVDDSTILSDTPRHYYYSFNIERLLESTVTPYLLEIGGAYGGLCLQNWKRFKGRPTIVNVDLFPALVTAYFYLSKHGVPVNVVSPKEPEIKEETVNLLCANDCGILSTIVPKCDLIFNSRSLCEMDQETITVYFKYINQCEVKYLYHENSNFLLFPESERHIEVIGDDFPIDSTKYRLRSKYISPFTGGDGRYREYIYEAK